MKDQPGERGGPEDRGVRDSGRDEKEEVEGERGRGRGREMRTDGLSEGNANKNEVRRRERGERKQKGGWEVQTERRGREGETTSKTMLLLVVAVMMRRRRIRRDRNSFQRSGILTWDDVDYCIDDREDARREREESR